MCIRVVRAQVRDKNKDGVRSPLPNEEAADVNFFNLTKLNQ